MSKLPGKEKRLRKPASTKNWEPARLAASAAKIKRYLGRECSKCGGTLRFVYSGACVACKHLSDYTRIKERGERINLWEPGYARISEEDNRAFLSDLAKEKAGWP